MSKSGEKERERGNSLCEYKREGAFERDREGWREKREGACGVDRELEREGESEQRFVNKASVRPTHTSHPSIRVEIWHSPRHLGGMGVCVCVPTCVTYSVSLWRK